MLEIRPSCENWNKSLPYDSEKAMICTFECTFCTYCIEEILLRVCTNCGVNFTKQPIRPEKLLKKHSISQKVIYKPVSIQAHLKRIQEK